MGEEHPPARLPLFPLHAVLCPGVALPLHIFEERYRLMVGRCLERGEPFGVVLIRAGREVGPLRGRISRVGTTAAIRQASRLLDGRLDIITRGGRRFRIDELDAEAEPYLVGQVTVLDEPLGAGADAARLAQQISRRFLDYLALLQPAPDGSHTRQAGVDTPDDPPARGRALGSAFADGEAPEARDSVADLPDPGIDRHALDDAQRHDLLMAAARRLTSTGDPTSLSYLISGLIAVDLSARQALLEVPDTISRLQLLATLIRRESGLLRQGLRPITFDPAIDALRRN